MQDYSCPDCSWNKMDINELFIFLSIGSLGMFVNVTICEAIALSTENVSLF
jgi:hypothetical protein